MDDLETGCISVSSSVNGDDVIRYGQSPTELSTLIEGYKALGYVETESTDTTNLKSSTLTLAGDTVVITWELYRYLTGRYLPEFFREKPLPSILVGLLDASIKRDIDGTLQILESGGLISGDDIGLLRLKEYGGLQLKDIALLTDDVVGGPENSGVVIPPVPIAPVDPGPVGGPPPNLGSFGDGSLATVVQNGSGFTLVVPSQTTTGASENDIIDFVVPAGISGTSDVSFNRIVYSSYGGGGDFSGVHDSLTGNNFLTRDGLGAYEGQTLRLRFLDNRWNVEGVDLYVPAPLDLYSGTIDRGGVFNRLRFIMESEGGLPSINPSNRYVNTDRFIVRLDNILNTDAVSFLPHEALFAGGAGTVDEGSFTDGPDLGSQLGSSDLKDFNGVDLLGNDPRFVQGRYYEVSWNQFNSDGLGSDTFIIRDFDFSYQEEATQADVDAYQAALIQYNIDLAAYNEAVALAGETLTQEDIDARYDARLLTLSRLTESFSKIKGQKKAIQLILRLLGMSGEIIEYDDERRGTAPFVQGLEPGQVVVIGGIDPTIGADLLAQNPNKTAEAILEELIDLFAWAHIRFAGILVAEQFLVDFLFEPVADLNTACVVHCEQSTFCPYVCLPEFSYHPVTGVLTEGPDIGTKVKITLFETGLMEHRITLGPYGCTDIDGNLQEQWNIGDPNLTVGGSLFCDLKDMNGVDPDVFFPIGLYDDPNSNQWQIGTSGYVVGGFYPTPVCFNSTLETVVTTI